LFQPPLLSLLGSQVGALRRKQTKRASYHKPARASPCGQSMVKKGHIGVKALPAEYVEAGRIICKQRKFIAKNPGVTRRRQFKYYPGEGVGVRPRSTSLQARVSGRIKMTHDVLRDVMIMNVLPEPREELLRDEMWRYRTEHVEMMEENKYLVSLRQKALPAFGKEWVNAPTGPKPMRTGIAVKTDSWKNPAVKDPLELEPFAYPMTREMLRRWITKVRRQQKGLEDLDPDFEVTDSRFHLFKGQSAQR